MNILYTVLAYSLILTIICCYKDASSYSAGIEPIDMVVAGPVMWLLLLVLNIPVPKKIVARVQNRKYKPKNGAYIAKIVRKVMESNKGRWQKDDCFNFDCWSSDEYGDYYGLYDITRKKRQYERLNKKFESLLYNQKDETVEELKKYFDPMTPDYMRENGASEWEIQDTFRNTKELWMVKGL